MMKKWFIFILLQQKKIQDYFSFNARLIQLIYSAFLSCFCIKWFKIVGIVNFAEMSNLTVNSHVVEIYPLQWNPLQLSTHHYSSWSQIVQPLRSWLILKIKITKTKLFKSSMYWAFIDYIVVKHVVDISSCLCCNDFTIEYSKITRIFDLSKRWSIQFKVFDIGCIRKSAFNAIM